MPATSRIGLACARRSAIGRDGSPSKSMMRKSSRQTRICCRCRSPWMRVFSPAGAALAARSMRARSASRAASTGARQRVRAGRGAHGARSSSIDASQFGGHRLDPAAQVRRGDRLGVEVPDRRALAERHVQFGDALRQALQALHRRLRGLRGHGFGRLALVAFEQPHQLFDEVHPGVALVLHLRLQQRQRGRLAVLVDPFEAAQHRHAAAEAQHVGQEAADLDLEADARLQPPVGLEEQPVAEQADRVAAGRQALQRQLAAQRIARDLRMAGARYAAQRAALRLQRAAAAHRTRPARGRTPRRPSRRPAGPCSPAGGSCSPPPGRARARALLRCPRRRWPAA